MDSAKFSKLLQRLEKISEMLVQHPDFRIHRYVNHSYYLQRIEEMRILLDQLTEAEIRLEIIQHRLRNHYHCSFHQWNKDARWLSGYLHR
jgi:hypothetical protein